MNRGIFYLLLWLGTICFMAYQFQALATRMYTESNQHRTPINKANWANPKAMDVFMFQDSSEQVNYLRIAERKGEDSLLIHKGRYTFYLEITNSIYNKTWNYDFIKRNEMYLDSLSYLSFSNFNKRKEQAHLTKSFQELPQKEKEDMKLFFWTQFYSFILILVPMIFFIVLYNFANSILYKKVTGVKQKILLSLVFSLILIPILYRTHSFLYIFKEESLIVSILFFGQTFTILFTGLLIFSFLKRKISQFSSFADREFLKFLNIIIGGFLLTLSTSFVSYHIHLYFGVDLGFSNFNWRLLTMPFNPSMWFLLASANLIVNFQKHFLQIRKEGRIVKLAQKRELESKAELDSLHASVNPHFLYNSLNSIASLAQENPEKTEEMAIALSTFYKYNTNRKEEQWATVADEIEMIRSYLNIEKIRFGDRLQTNMEVEETCKSILIPRFLLQPLVENAIKYGYNSEENKISVDIIIKSNNKTLTFSIFDKGPPFSETLSDGYGLRMVQRKLRLLLPDRYEIDFLNEPEKEVRISIELE